MESETAQALRLGATETDWAHLSCLLGLTSDLLPVVSNPEARISPTSTLKSLGKTPSRYNRGRMVSGFADWTSYQATAADVIAWAREPDYGICLQTREVRAIDIDITDWAQGNAIRVAIERHLGKQLPLRYRDNSSKCLLLFRLPGQLSKRVIKALHGIVEFLATGQQCVVAGMHPSGAPYLWAGGLPDEIPELTLEEFEALWALLERDFAIEPSTTAKVSNKAKVLSEAAEQDPVAVGLWQQGVVLGAEKDGRLHVDCPWKGEHTDGTGGETSTTYWPAHTGGYERGHFKCLHASHAHKTDRDFLEAFGLLPDMADDYEAAPPDLVPAIERKAVVFDIVPARDFKHGKPLSWFIKGVVPRAELVLVYGEPGSGKSFLVFDMAASIGRGIEWFGRKVKRARVLYICAEGAIGMRNRIKAYCERHGIEDPEIYVLAAAPNLLDPKQVVALGESILASGSFDLVIIDTLAQVTPGGNENSGEDMGLVISHCRTLHQVTQATVLLVHHSGKDPTKGSRGWSGVKGALDCEIEILRSEDDRTAKVTKMKDGGDGSTFAFKLEVMVVGVDEDGESVTSCVIEPGDVIVKKRRERKGAVQEKVLKAIRDLTGVDGVLPSWEQVLEEVVEQTPLPEGKKDGRRSNADRAMRQLRDKEIVSQMENGGVYIKVEG